MDGEKHPAATRPNSLCPSCRQPLPTTVQRHKTMGVYVPLYTAGRCTNPGCAAAEPAAATQQATSPRWAPGQAP
ncbi:hypothetical protein [Streptomyces sp. NRRL F-2664]|uniref:hypothetical protein n=1 Tax=Streptomyces sp. NRRL F-2664 TaxID=1463842 RepID=UPI0009976634|nr:hypothetical protein [Streptomyces sp. NRRL F-2664]